MEYYDTGKIITHNLKIFQEEIHERIFFNEKEIHQSESSIYGFSSKLLIIMKTKKIKTIQLAEILRINKKRKDVAHQKIANCMKRKPELFLSFLKIADETIDKFVFNKEKKPVTYISKGSNDPLEFSALSDGTWRLINLYEVIHSALFKEKVFLLIDEIENSLHFTLIKFLITIFKKGYNKLNSQLLFSTHNPYILDDTFKNNPIYFIDDNKLIKNQMKFNQKIMPGYQKGELAPIPDYKYRFKFLENIISIYEKDH